MTEIIDSHQHFWVLGMEGYDQSFLSDKKRAKIRQSYLPQDLEAATSTTPVNRSIFVQTQHHVAENDWALALADRHDFIAGVVGWVDLASTSCEDQILTYKDYPKFVGVRHVTHDEPDKDFILRDDVLKGLALLEKHQLPFDLLFFQHHLHHAVTLAKAFPKLRLVIDHLSNPSIAEGLFGLWEKNFRAAAEFPNIFCKLSGMITQASWKTWTASDLQPYVDIAIEAFGPNRLMFGSDWPVCLLAGTYPEVYNSLNQILTRLDESERMQILGITAQRFYQLPKP
ncbi:MAG: amidohydrolase [Proteobacteria bacterium]|nr:amidohydrolase [Pseudomonadota bacterium]